MKSSALKNINKTIEGCADWITRINAKIESINGHYLEFFACVTYIIAHLLMAIFHEPWFDEAAAWQIAKCSSLKHLLFEVPHYEGHPPLWHLILMPFAKLGCSYEISLTLISLIFAGAACVLIIWKAPFPRIVRLLLPFTYFFFYQYGVISRPYCVMMLAFVLLAMEYHNRNKHPWKYTLLLMFLCLTSAYGIVIAGGLAAVWVFEIYDFKTVRGFFCSVFKDKRTINLFVLLVFALGLVVMILPRPDNFAVRYIEVQQRELNSFLYCFAYMFFAIPMEVSATAIYTDGFLLKITTLNPVLFIAICILGIVFWIITIAFGKTKRTIPILIIPYVMFAAFGAFVYLSLHHIGIGLLFFVFWFWITCSAKPEAEFFDFVKVPFRVMIKKLMIISGTIIFGISLYWTAQSCYTDVLYTYSPGREEAKFIQEYGLNNYRIMAGWSIYIDDDDNIVDMDINHCNGGFAIAPYFDHNLFFNVNDGKDELNYPTHVFASDEYIEKCFDEWDDQLPDVLYSVAGADNRTNSPLEIVYGEKNLISQYTLVYEKINRMCWKNSANRGLTQIYVKTELAEQLGLIGPPKG